MADPVLYVTIEDLEAALSRSTVVALFDDEGNGTPNEKTITATLARASRTVDSYLARVYLGPFPVTQKPVPEQIKNAALEFAISFSFERHPEYVHTYGEQYRAGSRYKRATEIMDRLCQGQQEIPDWTLQPKPRNVGGIIYAAGPRTIIDGPNGEYNGGDF